MRLPTPSMVPCILSARRTVIVVMAPGGTTWR